MLNVVNDALSRAIGGLAMRRRDFITIVGGATIGWPLAARAQQASLPVVGFLGGDSPDLWPDLLFVFRQGLKETGYVEGQNLVIEYHWAEGHNDRLSAFATDLVRRQVAVIVAGGTPSALAAKEATAAIPIVFFVAGDPVELGLVARLNRPGGNLTGSTTLTLEVASKWLELLHELMPTTSTFALLINPTSPALAKTQSRDLQAAGRKLGLQVHLLEANTDRDFDTAFARLVQLRAGGLVISSDTLFERRSEELAALARRYAVPAICGFRAFAMGGGLMSYGASITDAFRAIGVYTGRVLKGKKPADLPVQQATKVELTINLKTAKALNLTVPLPLLGRADEVIE
jgi:putative tryptophan/tyrosine transport system substrate-binding protein